MRWARGLDAAGPYSRQKVSRQTGSTCAGAGVLRNSSVLSRPFVIGDYADGSLFEVPLDCPLRGLDAPCDVTVHALRSRKAGPTHPLAVCRCHAHDFSFTIYPPGFVPFSRRVLIDGPGISALSSGAPSFASAARDAAVGVAWCRASAGGSARWWATQGRLLRRLCWAVGALAGSARDLVAVAVGLPLHLLVRVAQAVGFRARGRALGDVLDAFGAELDRVLLAGFLSGCWGAPWRWQTAPSRLVPLVPAGLTRLSTSSGRRGQPPFS